MTKRHTLEETYDRCVSEGQILQIEELNLKKAETVLSHTRNEFEFLTSSLIKSGKEMPSWNFIYRNYYDILHELCEALLRLDKTKARTHQALFSYLCMKHPYLELDWDFFEKIRTKRNGIMYYFETVSYTDWKSVETQIKLYINFISKEIEKKIKE